MVQIADLVLYPMAKGGYCYERSLVALRDHGKLIDCLLSTEDAPQLGIKYS